MRKILAASSRTETLAAIHRQGRAGARDQKWAASSDAAGSGSNEQKKLLTGIGLLMEGPSAYCVAKSLRQITSTVTSTRVEPQ